MAIVGASHAMAICVGKATAKVWMIVAGIITEYEEVDFDYSEYMGPGYKKEYDESIKTSTIVSNHVSWHDTMNLT